MEKALGRIENLNLDNRTFQVVVGHQKRTFTLSRAQIKKYNIYLHDGLYVDFEYTLDATIIDGVKSYPVVGFIKMMQNVDHEQHIYFNINKVKKDISKILNKKKNKLFIDLEFSMPAYDHKGHFLCEIVQYGFVVLDEDDTVIYEDASLVKPYYKYGISDRLIDFLHIDAKDFKDAKTYKEFYHSLKQVIEEYEPMIFVWGTNDITILDRFYKFYKLPALTTRASFINLMQVIKNYYGLKNDIGLFNALSLFDDTFDEKQIHDALDDALVTGMVYHQFKMYTNELK